jgi:hypothetical protein
MRMRGAAPRTLVLVSGLLLMSARTFAADRQIRPFVGATFGGGTTFVDPENPEKAAGKANPALGLSAVFLGEVFGAEVDVADAPGFFDGDKHLVLSSRVTTISGNVVVAAPHRLTEYSLRPYLVGGAGLMRVRRSTASGVFDISSVIPQLDAGVGVVAFLTNRVGVCWDVRRFQSVGGKTGTLGLSFAQSGEEQLSFWRASMAAVIRY